MKIGRGDFWHGDCLDLMPLIPDGSVDLVLTDVPYNAVNRKSSGLRNLDKGIADSAVFDADRLFAEIDRVCRGSVYVFCDVTQVSGFLLRLSSLGFSTRLGVWQKTNPSPMNGQRMWLSGVEACAFGRRANASFNEHCKPAVWSCPSTRSKIHATQKPVALFERLIKASSLPGDTVLDMFAGSGTTAIAAENTSRRWLCIEQDQTYYDAAVQRVLSHEVDPFS